MFPACFRAEIGSALPNNQRQHRTSHAPKDVLLLRICAKSLHIEREWSFYSDTLTPKPGGLDPDQAPADLGWSGHERPEPSFRLKDLLGPVTRVKKKKKIIFDAPRLRVWVPEVIFASADASGLQSKMTIHVQCARKQAGSSSQF